MSDATQDDMNSAGGGGAELIHDNLRLALGGAIARPVRRLTWRRRLGRWFRHWGFRHGRT